jgi:hypothetical protein
MGAWSRPNRNRGWGKVFVGPTNLGCVVGALLELDFLSRHPYLAIGAQVGALLELLLEVVPHVNYREGGSWHTEWTQSPPNFFPSKSRERIRWDGELLNLKSYLQSMLETFFLQQ